jgi:hypothetical protein
VRYKGVQTLSFGQRSKVKVPRVALIKKREHFG